MFCSKCGAENPEGAKFCSKCGAGLGVAATPTEGAAKPEAESSTGMSANVAGLLCYVGNRNSLRGAGEEERLRQIPCLAIDYDFRGTDRDSDYSVDNRRRCIGSISTHSRPMVVCTCPRCYCLGDNGGPVDCPHASGIPRQNVEGTGGRQLG